MGVISERAIAKVSGRAWDTLRGSFLEVSNALLDVSDFAFADLTTTYIKYSVGDSASADVYAVIWVKSSKQLVVGLALPEDFDDRELADPPVGFKYRGLTKYFTVSQGGAVPTKVTDWAITAFRFVSSQRNAASNTP